MVVVEKITHPKNKLPLVVPEGVTEKRSDRVSMIIDMASELGEDASTITIVEEQDFEVSTDGDVVAVHLDCGVVPTIEVYADGKYQYDQEVFLKKADECQSHEDCMKQKGSKNYTCQVCGGCYSEEEYKCCSTINGW